MSFSQALTGLTAAADHLNTTGHNIANTGTVGYKKDRMSFADMYQLATQNYKEVGAGTYSDATYKDFSTGEIRSDQYGAEQGALSLALTGAGFFMLTNPANNQMTYTRNGEYMLDGQGYIVSKVDNRLRLMGVASTNTGNTAGGAGTAATGGGGNGALQSFKVDKLPTTPFSVSASYTDGTTGTVQKTGAYKSMTINSDGEILVGYTLSDSPNSTTDNTKTLAKPTETYTEISLGKIQITDFISPEKMLKAQGTNLFVQSATGTSQVVTPGQKGTGSVESKALENANINLTSELVDLILASYHYRANSQSVTAQNQMVQTAINMKY